MPTGRFAPSPTARLHLGNLRTALLAWLFARETDGRFLLRIEDLDQQRVAAAPGIAATQLTDLGRLGLDWDGPVIRQSTRLELYRQAVSGLDTYECYCTRREIAQASQAPYGDYRPYPGTCAQLTTAERAARRVARPAAIRVRAGGEQFTIEDRLAGRVTGTVDDFVLFRNDGAPAYNLAVVVDDGLQGVDQVCRGVDLLDSAPRQAWLANRLGFTVPEYLHVGLAINQRGGRLAKRDQPTDLDTLTARGVRLAEVLRLLCVSAGLPPADTPGELLAAVRGSRWWHQPAIGQPWRVDPEDLTHRSLNGAE